MQLELPNNYDTAVFITVYNCMIFHILILLGMYTPVFKQLQFYNSNKKEIKIFLPETMSAATILPFLPGFIQFGLGIAAIVVSVLNPTTGGECTSQDNQNLNNNTANVRLFLNIIYISPYLLLLTCSQLSSVMLTLITRRNVSFNS